MSRRPLSDDERSLWRGVARSIKPLRKRSRVEADPAPPAAAPVRPMPVAKPRPLPPPVQKPSPPPLAPLGRRFKQDVARGRRAIDGRLDLHGMTQDRAHSALLHFLHSAQARGARTVLVITGKGAPGGDFTAERGVLRRQVPRWLELPELRSLVIGFEQARTGHGGEGALYVSLRRPR
jgi:DNA-nicking Smr family endonuclease